MSSTRALVSGSSCRSAAKEIRKRSTALRIGWSASDFTAQANDRASA